MIGREAGQALALWLFLLVRPGSEAGEANSYIFDTKLFQLARPLLLQFKIAHLLPLAGGRHRLHRRGHFA